MLLRAFSWRRCLRRGMRLLLRGRSRVRQNFLVVRRARRLPLPHVFFLLRLKRPARVLLHRRLMG